VNDHLHFKGYPCRIVEVRGDKSEGENTWLVLEPFARKRNGQIPQIEVDADFNSEFLSEIYPRDSMAITQLGELYEFEEQIKDGTIHEFDTFPLPVEQQRWKQALYELRAHHNEIKRTRHEKERAQFRSLICSLLDLKEFNGMRHNKTEGFTITAGDRVKINGGPEITVQKVFPMSHFKLRGKIMKTMKGIKNVTHGMEDKYNYFEIGKRVKEGDSRDCFVYCDMDMCHYVVSEVENIEQKQNDYIVSLIARCDTITRDPTLFHDTFKTVLESELEKCQNDDLREVLLSELEKHARSNAKKTLETP